MNNNLGLYQDLVVAAKAVGGVAEYNAAIARAAVSKAAPGLAGAGAAAGAAITAVIGLGVFAGKKFLEQRNADQVAAEEAKERLVSEFANDGSQSGERPTSPATA
ncbi:hypothetical protein ACTHQY_04410 [Rhodococcoides corynebacterioides]|jgi:hypothetical protein|uniref:hypothetical protein n=1 Tax=Rhodococcoides corynebacterioides TaxID=53972 RepID=UPI003F81F631